MSIITGYSMTLENCNYYSYITTDRIKEVKSLISELTAWSEKQNFISDMIDPLRVMNEFLKRSTKLDKECIPENDGKGQDRDCVKLPIGCIADVNGIVECIKSMRREQVCSKERNERMEQFGIHLTHCVITVFD